MRRLLFGACLLGAALIAVPAQANPRGPLPSPCRPVEVRVALEPGGLREHLVAGRLCRPRTATNTLQVLLSGATYGSVYWDFPLDRTRHSYVAAMQRAGYAVLNVDRIGTGRSSRPPVDEMTFDADVHVAHQLVQAARRGAFGHVRFERVVTVGHSLGSAIALVEAARYDDVDGLILTGLLPHAAPVGAPEVIASLQPASLEPRFRSVPGGYLTTRPGTRGDVGYHRTGARSEVIALDEETKETVTPLELTGPGRASEQAVDEAIHVPVLSVIGEFDNIVCPTSCAAADSPAFRERDHYPNAPSFETYVQPRAGHVVNLHETAGGWFAVARDWLARHSTQPQAEHLSHHQNE
jgi:pimeloyl-ACP methyl ester carboxylesterase